MTVTAKLVAVLGCSFVATSVLMAINCRADQRVRPPRVDEEIQFAHVVCEARIVDKPEAIGVPRREWFPALYSELSSEAGERMYFFQPFMLVVTRVYQGNIDQGAQLEVLSGYQVHGEIFEAGLTALFLLRWNPNYRDGVYFVRGLKGLMPKSGDGYERLHAGTLPITEVEAALRMVSVSAMVGASEAILVSRVTGVRKESTTVDGHDVTVKVLEFAVEETIKGNVGDDVEVRLLNSGRYFPEFRKPAPHDFEIGSRWLIYLGRTEMGWHPYMGHHGMLRIDKSGELLRENRPTGQSLDEARRTLAREVQQ